MPVTRTRKEVVEAVEATGASNNGKENEGEYPKNLARDPYIRYRITFQKNSVPMLALFDSGNKVNGIYRTFA